MNRSQFFQTMAASMRETLKEVSAPFVEEKLDKFQSLTDELAGVKWYDVGNVVSFLENGIYERFTQGRHITIVKNNGKLVAFEKICPDCHALLQWISYDKQCKCFHCDKGFSIETFEGNLEPQFLPIRVKENKIIIGMKK